MFSIVLAVAASVMAQASAPPPSEPAQSSAPPAASAAQPPEKDPVICKSVMPLGSRLPQKVCARKSTLEQQARDGRRTVEDVQARSRGPFIPPP
ncbi:MAG TPA: hypothetical protein VF495_16425 [Phenylobacterium sp.]